MMKPTREQAKGRDLKLKGDRAYADRKWKKASELYREALEFLPGDLRVGQRLGDVYRRLNQNAEAIAQYKSVAATFAKDGFWAKAIAINKLILEMDPSDTSVQRSLATMYCAQGSALKTATSSIPGRLAAVSISAMAPRTMEEGPIDPSTYGLIGNTVSIAGEEPRTMDDPPMTEEADLLGTPVPKLNRIPLLSALNADEVGAVLERLAMRKFPTGALVCEEGDIGSSMYIIADGCVEVFTRDAKGARLVLGELRGGDFFGEYGLLTNGERNASVEAKTELELLEITQRDFDAIEATYPRIWVVLEEYLQRRMVDTILRRSDVFGILAEEDRHSLSLAMSHRKVEAGEIVMAEGTPGDEMYFVKSGQFIASVGQGAGRVMAGEIGPGDYFGEVAMLTGKPRTATVTAKSEGSLYRLNRLDAAPVLKKNRDILQRLKSKIDARSRETAEAYQGLQEARHTLELV